MASESKSTILITTLTMGLEQHFRLYFIVMHWFSRISPNWVRTSLFVIISQVFISLSWVTIRLLFLLIVCALWTVKNVHHARQVRVAPNNIARQHAQPSKSSKDRQLIRMLLMDILIYALFSFMMVIFLMYQEITQHQENSFVRTQLEVFIRNVCFLSIAIPFCSSCYTNLIVSLTFRKEVKKALSRTRFCL